MKKRHFLLIAALSAFAVLTSSIAVATTTSGALNADATETTYTLSINKDNFERVGKTSTHIVKTASNYDLNFEVTPALLPAEGAIGTLKKGAIIKNTSKIKGIKRITVEDNVNVEGENTYSFYMGYDDGEGGIKLCTGANFSDVYDSSHITPTYFQLCALKDVTITSIKIEYSCNETPMPNRYRNTCQVDVTNDVTGTAEEPYLILDYRVDNTNTLTFSRSNIYLKQGWNFLFEYVEFDTNIHFQLTSTWCNKNYGTAFYSRDVSIGSMDFINVNKTGNYEMSFTAIYGDNGKPNKSVGWIGAITDVSSLTIPPVVYVELSNNWAQASAKVSAYLFNSKNGVNTWADSTIVDADKHILKFEFTNPEKYNSIIFVRSDPNNDKHGWPGEEGIWNQTSDIAAPSDPSHNLIQINSDADGWNKVTGTWKTYIPQ